MPILEELCAIDAKLQFDPVGKVPTGMRIDVPFEGTATSAHWDGERPVRGIDYVTIRSDGNMALDVRGRIGKGKDTIAYRATGVSIARDANVAEPRELLTFETSNEAFAHLNSAIGVAFGRGEGDRLRLTVHVVKP